MVPDQIKKQKTLSLYRYGDPRLLRILIGLTVMIVALVLAIIIVSVNRSLSSNSRPSEEQNTIITIPDEEKVNDDEEDKMDEEEIVVQLPEKIDFQPAVDSFANASGVKSVIIYDLERDEMVGEYNANTSYFTASLYKLFVVYEGYIRVQNGIWDPNAPCGSTGRTIIECLDLAIRESNSTCAETLWTMIGRTNLDSIVNDTFSINETTVSRLVTTPNDILKIMKMFYEHKEITDETLLARMKDSFLNQPITEYNWRQGLPSGFSSAKVYNKVGWDWSRIEILEFYSNLSIGNSISMIVHNIYAILFII